MTMMLIMIDDYTTNDNDLAVKLTKTISSAVERTQLKRTNGS